MLKPLTFHTTEPAIPHEPPEGSVLRFEKGGGHYCYVAVRRGARWETTAAGNWGSINESMAWQDLAIRVRRFEIATEWSAVTYGDSRVREHRAVVRFNVNGLYLAAVNVCDDPAHEGDWYTTLTEEAGNSCRSVTMSTGGTSSGTANIFRSSAGGHNSSDGRVPERTSSTELDAVLRDLAQSRPDPP